MAERDVKLYDLIGSALFSERKAEGAVQRIYDALVANPDVVVKALRSHDFGATFDAVMTFPESVFVHLPKEDE